MTQHRRSAIALRHVAFEDLGLLAPVLEREGWDIAYREASMDDLDDASLRDADLLVVLGGPIGVYEADSYPFLAGEMALIEQRLSRDLPVLGICLGAQLMARALGARVYPGPVKEIGWGRVELTGEGAASCLSPLQEDDAAVLHWHGDTFDLPDTAQLLASNQHYQNQAFAHGRNALALQFHLEADPHGLEQWYVGHAAELGHAKMSVAALRAETVFSRWLGELS
jgi:GMP synthase (glutamine-hydrolysing)